MTIAKSYGLGLTSLVSGEINFVGASVKALLCSTTYVPNQDTHRYLTDITGEVSGAGYTAGGVLLTSKSAPYTAGTNTQTLTAANPTWATVSITQIRFVVFYMATGTAATSALISYMDFATNYAPSSQAFTVTLPATGIITYTAA